ncbi:MAG TPA: DUF4873 domain-containing protein [Actinophytocola sp.]|uniref:DUF4873 domain-containing protein n=1 Tax=Actinophytocola sp. TaxID=1872138 RepID=UPI002DB896C7|nr:DUF4873 domain-containing protein [Actinophytocola sp.]HEU5471435.1 DUF4873 domain-containing protein [Actinophytocola sp.]
MSEHDEEGYAGPATLTVENAELAVTVVLRGQFEPIDGFYHWYGRIDPNDELTAVLGGRAARAVLDTGAGTARGLVSEPDPWGRYRITGTSRPPFAVATSLADLDRV